MRELYSQEINRRCCRNSVTIFRDNRQVRCSLVTCAMIEVAIMPVICKCLVVPNLLADRFGKLGVGHVLYNLQDDIFTFSFVVTLLAIFTSKEETYFLTRVFPQILKRKLF